MCVANCISILLLQILDINIKAVALLLKEAHPHLKASKNGSVVLVSSIAGYFPIPVSSMLSKEIITSAS